MKRYLGILAIVLAVWGCSNPNVRVVDIPEVTDRNGIRVRRSTPYEMAIFAVDGTNKLVLKDWQTTNLPDPNNVYVINYTGAMTSSIFKVTIHEDGSLKNVRVESTRTLKASADASKAITEEILQARKAKEESEKAEGKRPQQELLEQIKAIKEYRESYGAATALPIVPGEPPLPDGNSLPGSD